jgi:mono/diheme cytochrome c family protein
MHKHLALVIVLVACGSKPPPPAPAPAPEPAPAPVAEAPPPAPAPAPSEPVAPAPDPEKVKADLLAAETAAYDKAKPVFAKYCASCHVKGGKRADAKKLKHFDMTTYPFGGEHAKSIGNEVRITLGVDTAKKPSMPADKPGSVKGEDLAAITAWTEAWRAAGQGGVHPADPADKDDD